jgi:hypothetical protein
MFTCSGPADLFSRFINEEMARATVEMQYRPEPFRFSDDISDENPRARVTFICGHKPCIPLRSSPNGVGSGDL